MTTFTINSGNPLIYNLFWLGGPYVGLAPQPGDALQILGGKVSYVGGTGSSFVLNDIAVSLGSAGLEFQDSYYGSSTTFGSGTRVVAMPGSTAVINYQVLSNSGTIIDNAGTLDIVGDAYTVTGQGSRVPTRTFPAHLYNYGNLSVNDGALSVSFRGTAPATAQTSAFGQFDNAGSVTVSGSTFRVGGQVGGVGTILISSSVAQFEHGVGAGQAITLDATSTLRLDEPGAVQAAIQASIGATIDLRGIGTARGITRNADGSWTLIGGTATATLNLAALPAGTAAQVSADGAGGTLLRVVSPPPIPAADADGVSQALDTPPLSLATLFGPGLALRFAGGPQAIHLVDGTLSLDPGTKEASVQRIYAGLLGRAGDGVGLAAYSAMLRGGASVADVAGIVLNSVEYAALRGAPATTTDDAFVTSLYAGMLGRAPDAPGLSDWLARLAGGASRASLAAGFAQSDEARLFNAAATAGVWVPDPVGATVYQMFEAAFGRLPDASGYAAFSDALQHGLTAMQAAQSIVGSPEFATRHAGQTAPQLISAFYADGLGHAPDAPGLVTWTDQMARGGPASVLLGIATSAEASARLSPAF